jgi:nitrogenase molybdenum-iron protein alpha/beta subunit
VKEREREAQAREKEAVRRHELEMKQLEVQAVNTDGAVGEHHSGIATATMPKLPQFIDGQDDLDSYLQRFERFAKSKKWN